MINFYNITKKPNPTNSPINMSDILTVIKVALAQNLEKIGSSLEEFESLLNAPDNMEKMASGGIADMLGNVTNAALLTAVLTGGLAGTGAFKLKQHLFDQDENIKDKQQEISRINLLTKKLKAEHNLA